MEPDALFHNAARHTPPALPGIIEALLQDGSTFVPISQIILPQPYTIDHTGRQLPDKFAAAIEKAKNNWAGDVYILSPVILYCYIITS